MYQTDDHHYEDQYLNANLNSYASVPVFQAAHTEEKGEIANRNQQGRNSKQVFRSFENLRDVD